MLVVVFKNRNLFTRVIDTDTLTDTETVIEIHLETTTTTAAATSWEITDNAIGGSHVTLGIIASHYNIALDIVDKPKLYNQKPHNRWLFVSCISYNLHNALIINQLLVCLYDKQIKFNLKKSKQIEILWLLLSRFAINSWFSFIVVITRFAFSIPSFIALASASASPSADSLQLVSLRSLGSWHLLPARAHFDIWATSSLAPLLLRRSSRRRWRRQRCWRCSWCRCRCRSRSQRNCWRVYCSIFNLGSE